MPSTYTVNLGIEKPATGEQSGTWGDTTNTNFDILDQAINGAVRITLTSAGTSGSPNQLQITNGAASDGRNKWIEVYSASDLGGSAYLQLDPNDAEKILFIRNSLAGSQSILLFQGTYNSGRDLEVPAGVDMVVKFDGGGASAATVTDVYTKLRVTELTTPTLTATTADINGGTLDNSVIGGTTAAAITGTTIVANTSLNIAGDGATVTGIKDEDDMSSNSPTKLATQQSIKAYVDSQVGTVDTWAEVLANGATSGSTNPEVTAGQALKTDTINETTAGSGVTIDSVLLKDDVVNATDVETGSISANDGTASATIANSTGVMTIASSVLTTTDINAGSIDNTNIGAATPATIVGTTIVANTSLNIAGDGATVTGIKDEDDMSSNSPTKLATQQSIKAYVDSQVGANNELSEVLANGNTTGGTDISVSSGDDVTFADSSKAIFGAGSDLQIYHDGSNSYIQDNGTGALILEGTTSTQVKGSTFVILRSTAGENMAVGNANGSFDLYYDASLKLSTTTSGVDITGTAAVDALDIDGNTVLDSDTTNTSSVSQTAVYSFSSSTYTGAKLVVCVTDNAATERYITEFLITHDGTTAVATEYGQVATNGQLATFDVDINSGNVRLLATAASTNSTTFKVMSTQLA